MPTFKALPLLALIALAPIAAGAEEAVKPLADIPNVTITPYDVTGRDAAAVRRAIDAARPTDPNDGKRVDGLSHYEFRWRWHRDAQSKCVSAPEDLTFKATVIVPRLANTDASPKLRERFDQYLQSLLAHEDGHVRYAWDHRGEITAAINAATCDTAGAAGQAALKVISAHDIVYDKATRHGATTVLPFG